MSTTSPDTSIGNDAAPSPLFTITPAALDQVCEVRSGEPDGDSLALRIEVVGVNGQDYTYDLSFVGADGSETGESGGDDHQQTFDHDSGQLLLVIPADSVDRLQGATLDLPTTEGQGGLVIRNPNRPNPLLDIEGLTLTGDAAEKIQQLLTSSINPSLASHGGFATLVGVDGSTAYLTMGGGCQGCSLSQATMVQGIASAITEAIAEITEVIDATDHSAGQNPFYS